MIDDKCNLLKAVFYTSASRKNTIIDERLVETFIRSKTD